MMRDLWGRPIGHRSSRPFDARRTPARPFGAPRDVLAAPGEVGDERARSSDVPAASEPAPRPKERPRSAPVAADAAPAQSEPPPEGRAELAAAQAEIEASRLRIAREAVREREAERLRLVSEVLPVLDDLDRSIAAARADERVSPALVQGFDLVRARLEQVLEGYGLDRIASVGEPFDPALHDAIAVKVVDDPAQQGVVVDEIARGYRAAGRVLRAAKVRVATAA